MKAPTARAITYTVVGILAVIALRATPPMAARSPAERLAAVRGAVTPELPPIVGWPQQDELADGPRRDRHT